MNRRIRKMLLIMVVLSIFCSMYAQFAGGSGTGSDPWLIATPEHLNNVRNYLGSTHDNKYFKQVADINLGVAPWNTGEGWVPIGNSSNAFYGEYNGNSKTVTGLTINRPSSGCQGLFGNTFNASISGLGVRNVVINANSCVGALVCH